MISQDKIKDVLNKTDLESIIDNHNTPVKFHYGWRNRFKNWIIRLFKWIFGNGRVRTSHVMSQRKAPIKPTDNKQHVIPADDHKSNLRNSYTRSNNNRKQTPGRIIQEIKSGKYTKYICHTK